MTPVQTLYRWFNDNPEATYKEALEAYEHCLELEQQLPQQEKSEKPINLEISDEEIEKWAKEYTCKEYEKLIFDYENYDTYNDFVNGAKKYREQLKNFKQPKKD